MVTSNQSARKVVRPLNSHGVVRYREALLRIHRQLARIFSTSFTCHSAMSTGQTGSRTGPQLDEKSRPND